VIGNLIFGLQEVHILDEVQEKLAFILLSLLPVTFRHERFWVTIFVKIMRQEIPYVER
jgi:hypothetical protein